MAIEYPVEGRRGTEILDIHSLVDKWDVFYEAGHGKLEEVFEYFKERCVREGYDFDIKNFVYRNKIKPIVQKRAESIPTWFEFDVDAGIVGSEETAEQIKDWLEKWVNSPSFGEGKNLWQALGAWNLWLERHGNLILKLAVVDGQVQVSRVDVRNVDVFVSPEDVTQVLAYEFKWEVPRKTETGTRVQEVIEYVDREVFRRYEDGELVREDRHNLGFIPVVHVINMPGSEGVWGRSVIEDLIEPQLMLAAVQSMIREVNRIRTWPPFAGSQPRSLVDLRPGGYTVDEEGRLRPLVWDIDASLLLAEQNNFLEDLYEKGRVMWKTPEMIRATGNLPSGKALLVLTQDGIQYIESVVSLLEESMAELLYKAVCMAGLLKFDPSVRPITVVYPPLQLEDIDARLGKGKLAIEAYARGLLPKRVVVENLINLDLFDVTQPVEEILQELEQESPPPSAGPFLLGAG